MEPSGGSKPLTAREAVVNQYQGILLAGAAGLALLSGAAWPLLAFAGANCLVLPFLIGNERIGRLRYLKSLSPSGEGGEGAPLSAEEGAETLPPDMRRQYESLAETARAIERNYARLSATSRPLIDEQRAKLQAILANGLSHLRALAAYEELASRSTGDVPGEIASLERRLADPATPAGLKDKYKETLAYKKRLVEALERSAENRAALQTELESHETALRILAQESAALLAPSEVAQRLDELLSGAESTNKAVRELEDLVRV